jgi:DNA primase
MTPQEQIKSRLDVVALVGSYVKLEKAGMNFKACCPFHSERTPSFYVSPARDIWHCFGCGKGGDIFQFVMDLEGAEFPEALRTLAERTGVELTRTGSSGEHSERAKLFALTEEATDFFAKNLSSHRGALEYLNSRGLTDESISNFRLGFAPESWRALHDHLVRKNYTPADIAKAGLSIEGSRGPYDRFRSRIIFPLEDTMGRTVGFAGRIFGEAPEGTGKYINTPATSLYDKSRYLYGLGKARDGIRDGKQIVIVEGNMDLILSHQAGVKNTVAVSGTALTEGHVLLMRRLSEKLVFAFDVDKAGVAASRRALELASRHDLHVRIVDITGGKDPADIVVADPARWRAMVEGATDSIAFFLKKTVGQAKSLDPLAKKKIGEEILPLVSKLQNEIEKAHWVGELSRILRVGEDAIWRELGRHTSKESTTAAVPPPPEKTQTLNRKARLEERMLGFLLMRSQLAALANMPQKSECTLAATGALFEHLQSVGFDIIIDQFLLTLPEDLRREAGRYAFEAEVFAIDRENPEVEFLELYHSWKELSIKEKLFSIREEIERLEALGRPEESQRYLEEFKKLTSHLAEVSMRSSQHGKKEK